MKRPIIGITISSRSDDADRYESRQHYASAVERAGGLPVLLPFRLGLDLIPQLTDQLDGVLFSGGGDLDPALYGESWHPGVTPCNPARQRFELALLAEMERRRTPVLGICLGCQLLNVHRRGSLIQFLPDLHRPAAIEHRKNGEWPMHPVQLRRESMLAETIGLDEMTVNSSHKQAVDRVGQGLRVSAVAPDGVIEAVEDPSFPLFMGVQWHPEWLCDQKEHLGLFHLLVQRAMEK